MAQNSSIFNFKLIRAPLVVVTLYVIMEIVFRTYSFGPHTALNWVKYNPRGILLTDIPMAVEEPDVSWKLRPNVETTFKNQIFTTNAHGFRSRDVSLEKAEGTIRVAVLGRSITMGAGVADDEVYTQLLQDQLDTWKPGKYEIINCAVGAYSLKQMMAYYEKYIAPFKPDILLIPLSKNDLQRSDPEIALPLQMAKPGMTNLSRYLGYNFLYESMRYSIRKSFGKVLSNDWKERAAAITNPRPETQANKDALASFIDRRNRENIPCLLFSPDRGRNRSPLKDGLLQEWTASQPGATHLSINDYMKGRMPGNLYIYFGDNHPSPKVHKLFAEALFNEFRNGLGQKQ